MPTYVYETITPAGGGEVFELQQSLAEPPLTQHPLTGAPVRRVYTAPNLSLKHGVSTVTPTLSAAHLARHGFSRYEKTAKGQYVKTAGHEGPAAIRAES